MLYNDLDLAEFYNISTSCGQKEYIVYQFAWYMQQF